MGASINLKGLGGNFYDVEKIEINVYPLEIGGESKQVMTIKFYMENHQQENEEIKIFMNHEFVEMKAEVRKNITTIFINKKEGKNGRNNKKE